MNISEKKKDCNRLLLQVAITLNNPLELNILPSWQKRLIFLIALVCLFVYLLVCNISQKVMNGLQLNFMGQYAVVEGRTD